MPRPTTKQELIDADTSGFDALQEMIVTLPDVVRDGPFAFDDRDRCLRDVIVHLTAWHRMMLRWYDEGMAGQKPEMPAPGYTWKTTQELNAVIWQDAQAIPLEQALEEIQQSHREVMAVIEAHTNDELFTKKYYPWTGSTSLGSYLVSSTSSHYDWALTKLRKVIRGASQVKPLKLESDSATGLPVISVGRSLTAQEVAEVIAE